MTDPPHDKPKDKRELVTIPDAVNRLGVRLFRRAVAVGMPFVYRDDKIFVDEIEIRSLLSTHAQRYRHVSHDIRHRRGHP